MMDVLKVNIITLQRTSLCPTQPITWNDRCLLRNPSGTLLLLITVCLITTVRVYNHIKLKSGKIAQLHRGIGYEFSFFISRRVIVDWYHCVWEWPSLSFSFFLLIFFLFLAICVFTIHLISLYWHVSPRTDLAKQTKQTAFTYLWVSRFIFHKFKVFVLVIQAVSNFVCFHPPIVAICTL